MLYDFLRSISLEKYNKFWLELFPCCCHTSFAFNQREQQNGSGNLVGQVKWKLSQQRENGSFIIIITIMAGKAIGFDLDLNEAGFQLKMMCGRRRQQRLGWGRNGKWEVHRGRETGRKKWLTEWWILQMSANKTWGDYRKWIIIPNVCNVVFVCWQAGIEEVVFKEAYKYFKEDMESVFILPNVDSDFSQIWITLIPNWETVITA